MSNKYLHRILPHLRDTFSDIQFSIVGHQATVENIRDQFTLHIIDSKIHDDDPFGFVKLKVPLKTNHSSYDQLILFVNLMNHTHRGCHWAVDTLADHAPEMYLYATLITELGRRSDDKDQIVMEILNLQKMKFLTDQYIHEIEKRPLWLNEFKNAYEQNLISCLAPENFLNPYDKTIYQKLLQRITQLDYRLEQINASSFQITNDKNTISILTFLGPELISLYSVVAENKLNILSLKKMINEKNQDLIFGHYEVSSIQNIICFNNYFRIAEGLRDIKLRLFLDSPDFAKIIYAESEQPVIQKVA